MVCRVCLHHALHVPSSCGPIFLPTLVGQARDAVLIDIAAATATAAAPAAPATSNVLITATVLVPGGARLTLCTY